MHQRWLPTSQCKGPSLTQPGYMNGGQSAYPPTYMVRTWIHGQPLRHISYPPSPLLTRQVFSEYFPRSYRLLVDGDNDPVLSRESGREGDFDGALALQRCRLHHMGDLGLAGDGRDAAVEDITELELVRGTVFAHQLQGQQLQLRELCKWPQLKCLRFQILRGVFVTGFCRTFATGNSKV